MIKPILQRLYMKSQFSKCKGIADLDFYRSHAETEIGTEYIKIVYSQLKPAMNIKIHQKTFGCDCAS